MKRGHDDTDTHGEHHGRQKWRRGTVYKAGSAKDDGKAQKLGETLGRIFPYSFKGNIC